MSLQTFPIASVQKIDQFIKNHLVIPKLEGQPRAIPTSETIAEMPEPDSLDALGDLFRVGSDVHESISIPNAEGRWFISAADAGAVLSRLPGLHLKSGYRLVTYFYRLSEDGMGATWAIPLNLSGTAHLEAALSAANEENPPYPEGALLNVMAAIEGDRSPLSFLAASLLRRELQEFGRSGKWEQWHHHRFISTVPQQRQWQWRMPPPAEMTPKVRLLQDGQAAVEFFTCRVEPPIGIYRHVDHYAAGQYSAKSIDQPIGSVAEPAVKR